MDARATDFDDMREDELRQLISNAQDALDRRIAKRAKQTLKEARRLAAEVGFEVAFTKAAKSAGKDQGAGSRGKAVQKYRNPKNPAETWSGRGRPPKWVQAALAEGQSLADLTIAETGVPAS
jgi:DNA-binding protein H-NS